MCGILGMIGTVPPQHWDEAYTLLQNIFIFSKSRGTDASGFSAIHAGKNTLITEKRPIDSLKFVERCSRFKALKKAMPNILVGHTRFSTSGPASRGRNNHPFNSNRYSLVHNGGVANWKKLASSHSIKMRTETDSEILLHLLERNSSFHDGIQNTMNIVTDSSRVAVANLQYDKEGPKLFLFRNDSNPISVMMHPKYNALFFASERKFLEDSLLSVWGAGWRGLADTHEVDIQMLPSWQSFEIILDANDGSPDITEEISINKPSKMGFSASGSNVRRLNGPLSSFIPTTSTTIEDIDAIDSISDLTTFQLMKGASEETREAGIELTMAMKESSTILGLIQNNPFMTSQELDHFKSWLTRV